jgi:hypothetical protein
VGRVATSALERTLAGIVGGRDVLVDDDLRAPFEADWTGRFGGRSRCVVRPADRVEVAAVLRACAQAGVAVVAQGGNTGLVGGGVPRGGEVVLSLTRLTEIGPVDVASGLVEAGAGGTLAAREPGGAGAGRASTSPRATRRRSAAWWPPTPAGSARCATAPCAHGWPGSRRSWPTARSSTAEQDC